MPRTPRGIQLGRRAPGGAVRLLDLLLLGGAAAAVVFGFGLRAATRELQEAAAPPAAETPASTPLPPDARAGQAAALLAAGVLDAPALSGVARLIRDAAPPGMRITSVEMRPDADRGFTAGLVADAETAREVAALLDRLAERGGAVGTSVISETRRPDGGVTVRVRFRIARAPA